MKNYSAHYTPNGDTDKRLLLWVLDVIGYRRNCRLGLLAGETGIGVVKMRLYLADGDNNYGNAKDSS